MRTALRKMGNSAGMIVPKAIIAELGSAIGEDFDIRVEGGRIIAMPLRAQPRAGWAEAAQRIGEERDEAAEEWSALEIAADNDWTW